MARSLGILLVLVISLAYISIARAKKVDICARIQCGDGFVCDPDSPGRPCKDIDECSLSPAKCKANEQCLNFIGTFECRDPCKGADCGSGLECVPAGRSYNCIDIDECRVTPRKCTGDQEICVNRYGSYNCKCRDQFERNPTTQKCQRLNPCTTVRCPNGHRCVVIDQNSYQCKDINECLQSPPMCRSDQRCINYRGGHYCTCSAGYRLNSRTNSCQDIDECSERRSGCSQVCENTPGSFVCRCREGYQLMSNKRTCRDVDECSKGSSRCSHTCVNTQGSFVCRCRYGYELSSDERTCRDKNECDSVKCAYRCINNPGSFRCICPRGYNTTNYYCSDFDECEAGSRQCKDNEYCFNTYGSARCMPKITCPSDYDQVSDTRCDRSCKDNDHNCFNKKVQSYSQWAFKLRDRDPPARVFSYRIVTYGYKKTPEIKYYFQPRNRNDTHPTNFEIITQNETSGVFAYIRNRNRIPGPKIFFLEFRGDVHDSQTGDLVSRFVHNMYVFVSRYNF
ncbi:Complement Clr-like EGF-like [Desmophyllum pertusum]|uniref:Complement Clr-like EGF-like n=1 Tax=Desmophyllum pertusum TaxID=174260 RepID=A0A9X0CQ89_9CNID|nr:Complement Clr-like EGF-like [Desmophyllum pertusum]